MAQLFTIEMGKVIGSTLIFSMIIIKKGFLDFGSLSILN